MEWKNGKLHLTIKGQPASMKNGRQIGWKRSKKQPWKTVPYLRKSDKALSYEQSIKRQIPILRRRINGPCKIWVRVYYQTQKPDLDCELIFDALQDRVYENDRQLREKHLYHAIDKKNPRAEIVIQPLEPELFQ